MPTDPPVNEVMMMEARHAIEALEAEGFVLMAAPEGTSFYVQEPEGEVTVDANGHDVRERFHLRLQADPAFRAAVKTFILAERPYGSAR
jgi:predicted RNA binding protein YcfA (HicA-like mRNA interferase family)